MSYLGAELAFCEAQVFVRHSRGSVTMVGGTCGCATSISRHFVYFPSSSSHLRRIPGGTYSTRSRTANADPQQQPPVKEKSSAKKKTAAISYDTITKVGPPRGHKKNDTSALSSYDMITRVGPPRGHKKTDASALSRTMDKATISTNRQRTGGSVSDAVGYVLYYCLFSLLL